MDAFIQFCQSIFQPLVFVFTVSNLLVMGLQVNLGEMFLKARKSEVPGFNLWIGLGNWSGYRLSDYINYFLLIMHT